MSSSAGRVLVIDDDRAIGRAVVHALAKQHQVTSLDDAGLALELLEQGQRFDVILCDLTMPGVTGDEFYREVAQRFPAELPKIVFLTGGAFTRAARQLLETVPNARLEKPFELRELRDVVNQSLKQ